MSITDIIKNKYQNYKDYTIYEKRGILNIEFEDVINEHLCNEVYFDIPNKDKKNNIDDGCIISCCCTPSKDMRCIIYTRHDFNDDKFAYFPGIIKDFRINFKSEEIDLLFKDIDSLKKIVSSSYANSSDLYDFIDKYSYKMQYYLTEKTIEKIMKYISKHDVISLDTLDKNIINIDNIKGNININDFLANIPVCMSKGPYIYDLVYAFFCFSIYNKLLSDKNNILSLKNWEFTPDFDFFN
jgi:hypothetical protein